MAILGDLADMPVVEILTYLGRRGSTGNLAVIVDPGERRFDIFLTDGKISHLTSPTGPAIDDILATMALVEILTVENGRFEFERHTPPPPYPPMELQIEATIMQALSIGDEINHGPRGRG